MNGNFHFLEKIEVEVPPPHVFRCETQNAIVDFSGCSWNFYILSKLGDSLNSILTENTINKILGSDPPAPLR